MHPGEANLGPYGEFLTFKKVVAACKCHRDYFKILNNVYLPSKNGTTEVDCVLIHETGIYVLESKNVGGKIYGSYKQKNWTQILEHSARSQFYNPVWQNEGHIAALKSILGSEYNYFSYVVFSERCVLAEVPEDSPVVVILRRQNLESALVGDFTRNHSLSIAQVDSLYAKLSPFADVSEGVKKEHIRQVKKMNETDDLPF